MTGDEGGRPVEPPLPPGRPLPFALPSRMDWLRDDDTGRRWLGELPGIFAGCVERWSLRVGDPYPGSFVSVVLPATRPDGSSAVLKLRYPDRESEHEGAALRLWGGDGAIRLLDEDPERHALLLESCDPGTPLHVLDPDDALDVYVGLLPRLWVPAGAPFTPLAEEATGWAERLPGHWERAGRPFERRLIDAAVELLRGLAADQGPAVLLHQDLHTGNVLRATREPWLVIDPKPLAGEREFGPAAVLRDAALGLDRATVRHRLDRISGELGLDRERVRGWAVGQALAWAFPGGPPIAHHVELARWLLER